MKKLFSIIFAILLLKSSLLYASKAITLQEAIELLKSQNLEIKSASISVDSAVEDIKISSGNHYGKLDFIQDFANSNDAGNVFGFKLSSREATFGDFGAREFMSATGANGGAPPESAYTTPPRALNYPGSRNFFQSRLKYEIPIFSGFKISSYEDIMNSVMKIKKLEKSQVINEKIYETRKSYYDVSLIEDSISNLNTILKNIETLENTTKEMIDIGYAKKVDLLEVNAKKGNIQRLISQMESNKKLLYHYISFLLNQEVTSIQAPSLDITTLSLSDSDILSSNLDIQMANSALEVKKSMIEVSQAAYYPMVGAFAEVSTADNTLLGNAADHKSYTLGARATWNIFNGGIDSSNIEKSRLEYLKTKTEVSLANSGIALKIDKIRTEIESYNKDIGYLKKELALADEIYKNYETRYKEKLSSMSDVIIKQSEQIQKILELQQTINKRNERIFALEKLANGDN